MDILKSEQKEYESRKAFAARIGTSESNIRRWEQDGQMFAHTCCAIIEGLAAASAEEVVIQKNLPPDKHQSEKEKEIRHFRNFYLARLTPELYQETLAQDELLKKENGKLKKENQDLKKLMKNVLKQ
jgi:hypothetical protein